MDILYFIVSAFLSIVFFSIIFDRLNRSTLHLFIQAQNFTSKLNHKSLYYWVISMIIIVFLSFIQHFFHFNYIEIGIPLGMLFSLNEIIFNTGFSILKKRKI